MIRIYEYQASIDEFIDKEADGLLDAYLVASFKYEKDALQYLITSIDAYLEILTITTEEGVFNVYKYVFNVLRKNKEIGGL